MRIYDACAQSNLTERAVRLYVREGLLTPGQHNGRMDFSGQDVYRLKQIALLRRYDFSIRQIRSIFNEPEQLVSILEEKRQELKKMETMARLLLPVLEAQLETGQTSVPNFLHRLEEVGKRQSEPDFSRFDEETLDEKIQLTQQAAQDIATLERKRNGRRRMIPVCIVLGVLLLGGVFYLVDRITEEYRYMDRRYNVLLQQELREVLQIQDDTQP